MSKVHIGKKIKEVWKKSRLKGTEFAYAINRDRQVIYDIFKRESIDTELLRSIGKVLDHDFFMYYVTETLKEPKEEFGYATKEDLALFGRDILNLVKDELTKFRAEAVQKPKPYKLKNKSPKNSKK